MEEIRGRRCWTSPGEERSNETEKLVIGHRSVEFYEATTFDVVDEPKESNHCTHARPIDTCVAPVDVSRQFYSIFFSERAVWGLGGGGGMLPYVFMLFSFPCSSRPRAGLANV